MNLKVCCVEAHENLVQSATKNDAVSVGIAAATIQSEAMGSIRLLLGGQFYFFFLLGAVEPAAATPPPFFFFLAGPNPRLRNWISFIVRRS
jgi:hypothetical protein